MVFTTDPKCICEGFGDSSLETQQHLWENVELILEKNNFCQTMFMYPQEKNEGTEYRNENMNQFYIKF